MQKKRDLELHDCIGGIKESSAIAQQLALAEGRVHLHRHDVRVKGYKIEMKLGDVAAAIHALVFQNALAHKCLPGHKQHIMLHRAPPLVRLHLIM